MLRGYIDKAYGNKFGTKRSDLFAGYNACWDVDELVALLRCVVTNTFALTGQNTTKVTGLFPRENTLNRTSDLFSLVSLFGVRGSESRNNHLYFNAQGELCDARGQSDYAEAIGKLNTLYKEGLIMQEFDTTKDTIYKVMYQQNLGFMIYDYCQTQALYNNDPATLLADSDFNLAPVMNPVAKWFDGSDTAGVWMRFTESWRSVKTSGWGIPTTCTGEKLQAALKMFDYMYSTEGAQLMSYGPSAWRSGKTITYKGQQIPELSAAALKELWDLAGGNYTNYARMYLGSTLPIGFVKDQGMEYQCTTEGGKVGAAKVSAAIAAGTLKHVTPDITGNLFYTMVPTVLPTSATQDTILAGYAALGEDGIYSRTNKKYNIYTEVLKNGFGSDVALKNTLVTTMPKKAADLIQKYRFDLGGSAYILIQQSAWDKIYNFYNSKFVK
jgi:putative aldouronate transport system substrate-binding protein